MKNRVVILLQSFNQSIGLRQSADLTRISVQCWTHNHTCSVRHSDHWVTHHWMIHAGPKWAMILIRGMHSRESVYTTRQIIDY